MEPDTLALVIMKILVQNNR